MRLPGRLRETTLGDLLGLMHRARLSGVLELVEREGTSSGRRHRIHLESGLIAGVESALPVPRLGEILRAQGLVGDHVLRKLTRGLIEAPGRLAGEILVEDVALAPSLVGAALRRQLRMRLDALFGLEDASVRFHVARPPKEAERAVPLSPREFLHGRKRWRERKPASEPRPRQRAAPATGRERARARALSVLGLRDTADRAAVLRAFRQLASKVHPDRHPSASPEQKAELLQQFAELSAAYHLLVA